MTRAASRCRGIGSAGSGEIEDKRTHGKNMYKVKLAQPALMQQIKQGLADLGSCTGQPLHKNDLCLIC